MSFHLGKPILVMLIVAAVSGGGLLLSKDPPPKDLTLWVFADSHYRAYQPLIASFEGREHISVEMQIVQVQAMSRRLQADFADELQGAGVPDVVEIEINQIGKFFRPPVGEVGFEPLRPMLAASGDYDKILEPRYAPWSKEGVIFGVPNDVHPCGITYREDLFREAGIDLSAAKTWERFREDCLEFQRYWRERGFDHRHAMEFPTAKVDALLVMLLQRGINLVDDRNQIHLTDPKVADTLAFYAKCVTGPQSIASEAPGGDGPLANDLNDGSLCALITADWRLADIKHLAPGLAGKMRFMELPRFDPTDAPTAPYGGTMIGILRSSKHKEQAWKLIEQLYFSRASLETRHNLTGILPPIKAAWDDPAYQRPDAYFGGQMIDQKLIELARQIPPRYVTPATVIANFYLAQVLSLATQHVDHSGAAGLEEACQKWLATAASDLTKRMAQWKFADTTPEEHR